ncbi:short-chain dehydrogenase [Veronia nyctiphanis]|uniref:Short-chain dehydrogenase n=1 Tax=Veronia nyctiphanis TaxID=1278244 RepID=A0A4Q0YP28_9GAMM|nr:SDR family NAD(P)-dependent oxidoreductase [Veronia nyctiphanis]RXJ72757.1 short-chain dehydrogenase [Veronia nyctiphanis]
MELIDKKIVITGGTSGIGLEVVRALAPMNQIIVIARNSKKLSQLAETFNITPYQCDLSDLEQVKQTAAAIKSDHPTLDVLINNAAVQFEPTFISRDFSYDNIESEITTNLTSVCCLTSMLLPTLLASSRAAVVNVNSGLALVPKTSSAVYCATKSALHAFSTSLRYQLADTNISVYQSLMPLVETNMTAGRGTGKMSPEEAASQLISGIERGVEDNDIGKVKILRWLTRIAPSAAAKLMKAS